MKSTTYRTEPYPSHFSPLSHQSKTPLIHIRERESDYLLSIDLPSLAPGLYQIDASQALLRFSMGNLVGSEDSILLKCESSGQTLRAHYQHGMLWVTFPKHFVLPQIDRSRLAHAIQQITQDHR